MENTFYVSLSGQLALQQRLETIANNVANSSTPGFRAENVTFESIISDNGRASVAFASQGAATFASNSGAITRTDNPLDVAIKGEAYLAFDEGGTSVFTRDGRLRISSTGALETASGRPVLDSGGAPIQIDAGRGPVTIASNGVISQGGTTVGSIGVFKIAPGSNLVRHEGSGLVPDRPAEPVVDFTEVQIVQGFLEGANVNPVLEMTRLIAVTRAFQAVSSMIESSDTKLNEAIRTLGGGH